MNDNKINYKKPWISEGDSSLSKTCVSDLTKRILLANGKVMSILFLQCQTTAKLSQDAVRIEHVLTTFSTEFFFKFIPFKLREKSREREGEEVGSGFKRGTEKQQQQNNVNYNRKKYTKGIIKIQNNASYMQVFN